MKTKLIYFLTATIFILMLANSASAWYYALGAGDEGDAEAQNFTIEFGKEDINIRGFNTSVGLAIPFILHGDGNVPTDTNDSDCPHSNCHNKGDRDDGTEIGLLGKFGLEIFDSRAFVSLILGMTQSNTVELSKSNITGEYYKEDEGQENYAVYGIGVSYMPEFFDWGLKMVFALDVDNRRGITGLIGWRW